MAALLVATPVQARIPSGMGWTVNENIRFQFVPGEKIVTDGNTITATFHVVLDGEREFPIKIYHGGNTCSGPDVGPNESSIAVCFDKSYYIIEPNWEKEGYITDVTLQCNRPIYIMESKLNLQSACDYYNR